MTSSALKRRAREARYWMLEGCFPLWSRDGVGPNNLFREALDITHRPVDGDSARVRVQARQTYVFSQALKLGWEPDRAERLVSMGVGTLTGPAQRADGLVGRVLASDGSGLIDDTADLYDIAFTLFALAQASMSDHDGALGQARTLLTAVDAKLSDAEHGGFAETLPRGPQRLQNPHMHLLEALHALHCADPEGGYLERARAIVALFDEKMFEADTGTLGEYFKPDWSPETGQAHDYVEPGHQFEWVWLLQRHADLTGDDLNPAMAKLYDTGLKTLDQDGRVFAGCTRGGQIVDGSRRAWMQTEALKAHLAMLELDADEHCDARAVQCFDVLMDEYLTPEGGWIDQYHADGQLASDTMPASTGYHVVLAFAELLRVSGV